MSLSRVFGQCALKQFPRPTITTLQWQSARLTSLSAPPTFRVFRPTLFLAIRRQSTSQTRSKRPPEFRYPEDINIFSSGFPLVMALGFMRIVTLSLGFFGICWVAPQTLLDPEAASYFAPFAALMLCSPAIVTGLFFGGFVFHMNMIIPAAARRSREELMKWAANVPNDTPVVLKSLWFRPWPHNKHVRFGDLRRLGSSWGRLANLEHLPTESLERMKAQPWRGWLSQVLWGRYVVNKSKVRDRGRVPGVLNEVWEQIPFAGEEARPEERLVEKTRQIKKAEIQKRVERKPVLASNRLPAEETIALRALRKSKPKR